MVARSQGYFKIMINGAKVKKPKIVGLKESKNVKKTTKIINHPWCPPAAPFSSTRRESIETINLDEAKDLILPRLLLCDMTSMKDPLDITTSFAHCQAHVFKTLTPTSLLTFETHLQHLLAMSNILIVGKNKNHPDLNDFITSNIKIFVKVCTNR